MKNVIGMGGGGIWDEHRKETNEKAKHGTLPKVVDGCSLRKRDENAREEKKTVYGQAGEQKDEAKKR